MNRQARYINVGDGHLLYVETQGAAAALPVLVLHDGPGYGSREGERQLLAGLPYRQVCIDQRGAGRSLPAGSLEANTTLDVVADLEAVRQALGIPAWVIVGGGAGVACWRWSMRSYLPNAPADWSCTAFSSARRKKSRSPGRDSGSG